MVMSAPIASAKHAGIASWFEASASPPPSARPAGQAENAFGHALQEVGQAAGSSRTTPTARGLAPFLPPGHELLLSPALAEILYSIGTGVPQQDSTEGGAPAAPSELAGVFREVAEDSVEPFNAVLFWRRPETPPSVAWQSKLVLAEALRQAGYDPKEFAVSYWETKGEWPGGMMVVPQLTVVAPNGRKADLSPELVVRSPGSAVEDIRRLMETPESKASSISSA